VIDWTAIQTGLTDLVETLSGVPAQMQDEPRDFVDPDTRAVALLNVFSVGTLNSAPERAYADGDPLGYAEAPYGDLWGDSSPNVVETVSEVEEVVLRVLVESYSQHPQEVARHLLERLRTRFGWTSTQTTLRDLGVSYQRSDLFTEVSTTYDDRVISAGVVDFRLTVRNTESDTENQHARIESAEPYHAGP
jgi:hypothetical protein